MSYSLNNIHHVLFLEVTTSQKISLLRHIKYAHLRIQKSSRDRSLNCNSITNSITNFITFLTLKVN